MYNLYLIGIAYNSSIFSFSNINVHVNKTKWQKPADVYISAISIL